MTVRKSYNLPGIPLTSNALPVRGWGIAIGLEQPSLPSGKLVRSTSRSWDRLRHGCVVIVWRVESGEMGCPGEVVICRVAIRGLYTKLLLLVLRSLLRVLREGCRLLLHRSVRGGWVLLMRLAHGP